MTAGAMATGLLLALLSMQGCGAPQSAGDRALLRMRVDPETASVYVDDRFLASGRKLASRPAELSPGVHFITVSAPGYFPHDVRLELPPGETTIELRLRPVPP